jgi:CRISPR-associated protein Cmr2
MPAIFVDGRRLFLFVTGAFMPRSWSDALIAWLHDPPDKALSIVDHESRARRYAVAALGRDVSETEIAIPADSLASATERLPMPSGRGDEAGDRRVGPEDNLHAVHPLSASLSKRPISKHSPADEAAVIGLINEIVIPLETSEQRFFALWRMLPERLAFGESGLANLPADTRTPDHTIWQHMDATAALAAGDWGGNAAFLSFSLGPVQSFIAAARSLRDLWTGSMILSWLTFRAMLPVIKELGPTALVYPAMRGSPFLDVWLQEQGIHSIGDPPTEQRRSPCLPNRFVAVVPWGVEGAEAIELKRRCEESARTHWDRLCGAVHDSLSREISRRVDEPLRLEWDRLWTAQLSDYFEIRTAVLPWKQCDDLALSNLLRDSDTFRSAFLDAAAVRGLGSAIPETVRPGGHVQQTAGQWQHRLELSAKLMEAVRSVRHAPRATSVKSGEPSPGKCSMLGSYEQMGPARLADSAEFWRQAAKISIEGMRLRANERFCAVALVKRFAGAFFRGELGLEKGDLRWQDTATVAAAEWLQRAADHGINLAPSEIRNWSGQWLHWSSREQDEGEEPCPSNVWDLIVKARRHQQVGPPPAYYAVLMLDGDHLGEWLRGALSPKVREIMHPKMLAWFQQQAESGPRGRRETIEAGFAAKRPVGPALHASISTALANFALHFVPQIVAKYNGELIYAGGDDVLALLPTVSALACACELSNTFREDWKTDGDSHERLLMGNKATVSAGLAVVHYKEDLRFALDAARKAEKAAKAAGRDALQVAVCRRSGEHAAALCPWEFADKIERWVRAFLPRVGAAGASDRWAYHLRAELPTLCHLPPQAMCAEIKRQLGRAEEATRRRFSSTGDASRAAHEMAEAFDDYRRLYKPGRAVDQPDARRFADDGEALSQLITLCQSASFLARGRDA